MRAMLFGEGPSTVRFRRRRKMLQVYDQIFAGTARSCGDRTRTADRGSKSIRLIDEDVAELQRIYEDALPGGSKRHD